jgi:VanZ family protein
VARSRLFLLWFPVVAWAAVIFAFSSIPSLSSGLGIWDTILRKGAHLTEYAVLGALLVRALGRDAPAFFAGLAYAATDEVHQHFVNGRHASPVDVAIDALGIAVGVVTWRRLAR